MNLTQVIIKELDNSDEHFLDYCISKAVACLLHRALVVEMNRCMNDKNIPPESYKLICESINRIQASILIDGVADDL